MSTFIWSSIEVEEEEPKGQGGAPPPPEDLIMITAVQEGDEATVRDLLHQGYSANEQDELGLVWPLLAAVKCNNMNLARLLIDHGATLHHHHHGERERTELHALAECQNGPFPPLPSTARSRGWISAIMQSWMGITPASVKFWQLLLSIGAKPDWQDQVGVTPFHLACARGNWPVVQFLLGQQHITNVDHADNNGQTGLHYAARFGHTAVVSLLLASRADAQAQSKHGDPAQVARGQGHTGVAEMIESWSYRACPVLFMPLELLHNILARLEPHDLCAVAQVCSTLNEASSADCLWRQFCNKQVPGSAQQQQQGQEESCKRRYMAWLQPRLKQYARHRKTCGMNALQPAAPRSVDHQYDHLLKLILLGDAGVGKTEIQNRFINGMYQQWHAPTTLSIEFGTRTIELMGLRFKLQLWDTAGQERFRSISRGYYRGVKGVVLVYDITCRPSWENTRRWAADLRQHNQEAALLLVGAKSDLASTGSRQVTPEEGMAMADELGAVAWLEVSSLTGAGVDEAFFKLTEATAHDLNPFDARTGGGGWCVPREQLLEQLFAKSPTGREMASLSSSSTTRHTCLVQ